MVNTPQPIDMYRRAEEVASKIVKDNTIDPVSTIPLANRLEFERCFKYWILYEIFGIPAQDISKHYYAGYNCVIWSISKVTNKNYLRNYHLYVQAIRDELRPRYIYQPIPRTVFGYLKTALYRKSVKFNKMCQHLLCYIQYNVVNYEYYTKRDKELLEIYKEAIDMTREFLVNKEIELTKLKSSKNE